MWPRLVGYLIALVMAILTSPLPLSSSQAVVVSNEAPVCLDFDQQHPDCDNDSAATLQNNYCGLWLAPSTAKPGTIGIYTGSSGRSHNERVAEPDAVFPIVDANKNVRSPIDDLLRNPDLIQGLALENQFLTDLFVPGIGTLAPCSDEFANIQPELHELTDSAGVNRSWDPATGSFTYHHNSAFVASRDLAPCEELFLSCTGAPKANDSDSAANAKQPGRPVQWVTQNGICLDSLTVGPSTQSGIGRGAFSKHFTKKDHVVASSPVAHLERNFLKVVEQSMEEDDLSPLKRPHSIRYTQNVRGHQLLLNYCFGHADSNVLLLPYAPAVNFVNHNSEQANAVIRWCNKAPNTLLQNGANIALGAPNSHTMVFEYVALRDIHPGEEILIDYGEDWVEAWDKHVRAWRPAVGPEDYMTAVEYQQLHAGEVIRTEAEQAANPYPGNLRTACYFKTAVNDTSNSKANYVEWSNEHFGCLRPCDVKERSGATARDTRLDALVYPMKHSEPDHCRGVPTEGLLVKGLPWNTVGLVNKPYITDSHLKSAFRHEIGVPADIYPASWMTADPDQVGDFIGSKLKPWELSHIRWKDTGESVDPNAYRVGLPSKVRETLLEYCEKMGIVDTFRRAVIDGNELPYEKNAFVQLNGDQWYLQRPGKQWRANMHWLSPGGPEATQDWLETLSAAGMDAFLKSVGETLGFDGLVAFHGTFMGVSLSTKHYLHYDLRKVGNKQFNVIIPLIVANETGPELDVQDSHRTDNDSNLKVGRYRYEYDTAVMVGDNSFHATSPVDYRLNNEFRLSATIYVADISEDNVDNVISESYTQRYPPADRDLLLEWAGKHWKKDDSSASLPRPRSDHILLAYPDITAPA